jgi:hypothetical protein
VRDSRRFNALTIQRSDAPSLPIASTGQPSIASLQRASSSGFSACLQNLGMSAVVLPFEVRRRGLAAQIAVDALVVDVKIFWNIFRVFVCGVCHPCPARAEENGTGKAPWRNAICFFP